MDKRFEPHARLAAIIFLLIGCFFVLRPFLAAMLFAACVGISSWPLYLLLLERLKGRRNWAAAIMTLSLVLVIVLPLALVTYNLADNVSRVYEQIRVALESGGLHPPAWLASIPVVGETIDGYVRRLLEDREELLNLGKTMLEPARHFLASGGILLGTGLAQTSLAVFVSFFLYRDGQLLSRALMTGAGRIIGDSAPGVGLTISRTVRGVMYGLLGTALAQALVAVVGFLIAGVPAVALLGVATHRKSDHSILREKAAYCEKARFRATDSGRTFCDSLIGLLFADVHRHTKPRVGKNAASDLRTDGC